MPFNPSGRVTNYLARGLYTVVGAVQLVRHPPEDFPVVGYWLENLRIWPLWRRMGIGEILTKRIIDQASKEGKRELFLVVDQENLRAYNLYRKLGFLKASIPGLDERLEQSYRQFGRRSIIMRKDLMIT